MSLANQVSPTCTRRDLLRAGGGLALASVFAPQFIRAAPAVATATPVRASSAKARSCILIYLLGGPPHIDMFDLKPDAPPEIRGEFRPIATSLTGLRIGEHLPATAKWMHRTCLIRTVTHNYNAHNPLAMMTGFAGGDNGQITAKASDPPDIGAVCQYLGLGPRDLPGAVCLPCYPGWGEGIRRPGPYGGWLGSRLRARVVVGPDREPGSALHEPGRRADQYFTDGAQPVADTSARRRSHRREPFAALDRRAVCAYRAVRFHHPARAACHRRAHYADGAVRRRCRRDDRSAHRRQFARVLE